MIPILFSLAFAALPYLFSPANAAAAGERIITVAAASDLNFAFKDIAAVFEKETGIKVILSFGSTGMLAKQVSGGAPVDLCLDLGADRRKLRGFAVQGNKRERKRNSLGVIVLA